MMHLVSLILQNASIALMLASATAIVILRILTGSPKSQIYLICEVRGALERLLQNCHLVQSVVECGDQDMVLGGHAETGEIANFRSPTGPYRQEVTKLLEPIELLSKSLGNMSVSQLRAYLVNVSSLERQSQLLLENAKALVRTELDGQCC